MARAREAASPPARAPPRARSRMLRHRARPGRQAHRPRTTTATRTTALSALKNRRTAHPPENSNGPLEAPIPSPKSGPETRTAWRAPFLDQKGVTNSSVTPFWSKNGARLAVPNSGPRGRKQRGAQTGHGRNCRAPDTHSGTDAIDGNARRIAPTRTQAPRPHGASTGPARRTGTTARQRHGHAKQARRARSREATPHRTRTPTCTRTPRALLPALHGTNHHGSATAGTAPLRHHLANSLLLALPATRRSGGAGCARAARPSQKGVRDTAPEPTNVTLVPARQPRCCHSLDRRTHAHDARSLLRPRRPRVPASNSGLTTRANWQGSAAHAAPSQMTLPHPI